MRVCLRAAGMFLLYGVVLFAQSAAEDPAIAKAKERLAQIQKLMDAGAASRAQLAEAQEAIADAEDAAILRKTIYGQDLTNAQSEEMIAAAGRRYERRKQAFDKAKKLVDQGVATETWLNSYLEEMYFARKECELAEERAKVVHELAAMAQSEQLLEERLTVEPSTAHEIAERYDGDGVFNPRKLAKVESAFESRFGKPLPISAKGETAVHRALGFDHTGRIDVALHPDQPEGVWLREYLSENHIPYFAFRQAVPGKATGAHIHIGPQSTRLAHGG